MANLRTINTKDLEFLLRLDKKLHRTRKAIFTPNMSGRPYEALLDSYEDSSMNVKEIQRVLKIVETSDFAFYPINTNMGFAVGFQVANPETRESLLKFQERQLPEGYNFKRLSELFMQPENVRRAKLLGEDIANNRNHYDY